MNERTRILLVDDEPLVREELGAHLVDDGYDVVTAEDGEEGLNSFRQHRPNMVITDVRMPRRDGLSLVQAIRAEDPNVPVAVITGHGTEELVIQALRAGVNDFIKKPVRIADLQRALRRMEAAAWRGAAADAVPPDAVTVVRRSRTYELENQIEAIPSFIDELFRWTAGEISEGGRQELGIALRELIVNAIEHGNLGLTFAEKTKALEGDGLDAVLRARQGDPQIAERRVTVTATLEGRRLRVTIADEGDGFNWRDLPSSTEELSLLSLHGRGVVLAQIAVDTLTYNDRGNAVTVEKVL
jgi:CheY-like chemotaxis protein/anti-sigma regulatory factor (Ser/Thr protein kinase)